MQWLIDGYNLMYAAGAAGAPHETADSFRRRRRRFLGDVADGLGIRRARETVIVFDAKRPPADFDVESTYEGMGLIFALEDDSADARIEKLIATHSAPKSLTVVSSDHRLRQAARRRRARTLTSDEFLDLLDRWRAEQTNRAANGQGSSSSQPERPEAPTAAEAEFWLEQFRDLEEMPEVREAVAPNTQILTDAEIERIRREVESSSD